RGCDDTEKQRSFSHAAGHCKSREKAMAVGFFLRRPPRLTLATARRHDVAERLVACTTARARCDASLSFFCAPPATETFGPRPSRHPSSRRLRRPRRGAKTRSTSAAR